MTMLWNRVAPILALAGLLAAFMAGGTSVASAQAANNTAKARESYGRGQQLFRQGDFVAAQTAFEAAYAAVPNPIVLLSIAECQVRTEQFAGAAESLTRYLTERPTAPDKAQVEAQIAKLREKPGFVNVISSPIGGTVFVDGVDTGKTTPVELELPSGEHIVFVELEGYKRGERVQTVDIGARHTLEVALEAVSAEPAPVAVAPVAPQPAPEPASRMTTPIWVAAGIAGAGVITGSILGLYSIKNKREFDKLPTEAQADKGERLALFADVGFGIAVAAGVTAAVLFLTADDEPAEQAFHVAPSLARGEAGLVGNLRF